MARYRSDLREFDVLVLPGGTGTRAMVTDAALLAWFATWPANRIVATVCTGSLLLGAVDDGQVVTAGGVTSAIDLGLLVVWRLMGPEVGWKVAARIYAVGGRAPEPMCRAWSAIRSSRPPAHA